ncbi:DUF7389 domain-containing protein [Halorarum halobium]|uniref:DUF7389 domain-containing protein n=1 Tax=Halorarum halobium TaxID=3075121 RepID=UPI0028A95076|nr:hypothetical protein [Halobaculum sp. XH14]
MKEELETGEVYVRVRSTRGTDTRDQDEVIVAATYDSMDEAEDESDRLNALLAERIGAARDVQPDDEGGRKSGAEPRGDAGAVDATPPAEREPTIDGDGEVSKVYVGQGSGIGGASWVPLPREVVFEEIAPMVRRNRVDDDSAPHVKMNFSSDVPISGWTNVDPDVVREVIMPLIDRHRTADT